MLFILSTLVGTFVVDLNKQTTLLGSVSFSRLRVGVVDVEDKDVCLIIVVLGVCEYGLLGRREMVALV